MLGTSKNERDGWMWLNIDSCGKPSSIIATTVSIHNEGPSALNRTGDADQGPCAPSGWSLRRCGDQETHGDSATVAQDKTEILEKTIAAMGADGICAEVLQKRGWSEAN